ncbi:MAG: dihydroneopterin aldolase [Prolixibacteraceae bacterium]|jgi:D-erythro-7,8-dihydroneopterin triphosphate epimerase|nr:dihydroneopterin aldolase [Prolixibacteraceae bacterium]
MAKIKVKNLLLRTFIGFNPEELVNQQDVLINFEIDFDTSEEFLESDDPENILDYKEVTKKVISFVQQGRHKLLEVLTHNILNLLMEDNRIKYAKVEVDKPHALRFTKSVSVVMEKTRST